MYKLCVTTEGGAKTVDYAATVQKFRERLDEYLADVGDMLEVTNCDEDKHRCAVNLRALAEHTELLEVGRNAIEDAMALIRGDDIDAMKMTTINATTMLTVLQVAIKAIADKIAEQPS